MSHPLEGGRGRVRRDYDYMGRALMWLLAFITFAAIVAFTWFGVGAPHSQKERSAGQTSISVSAPEILGRPLPSH
jgi:hypothetical protein